MNTTKKNTKALLDASQEAGLVVNPEKTKYMLMSHYQKAGTKQCIQRENRSFEDVAKFGYLGTTLTDQNFVYQEIRAD
jgi:hypothetical protein